MPAEAVQEALRLLAGGASLTAAQAGSAFDAIMRGEATPAQMAGLLVGLRVKGETPDEVAGAAGALRRTMVPIEVSRPEDLVDTCGTGGGILQTFNISTAAALVAAGAGVRIAKHGNRSFTSRSGSADVFEALGVPIDIPPAAMARAISEAGIVFMFAPLLHPAMRHVGPVRKELGVATVMNLVGPLANPASAGRQVLGVADPKRLTLMAGALAALGTTHALVVHGEPGLDEFSPLGPSRVVEVLPGGGLREWSVSPQELGLPPARREELAGGSPQENAHMIAELLDGRGTPGARAAVELNAAAAIYVGGRATSLRDALAMARDALAAGLGRKALDRIRSAHSNAVSGPRQ